MLRLLLGSPLVHDLLLLLVIVPTAFLVPCPTSSRGISHFTDKLVSITRLLLLHITHSPVIATIASYLTHRRIHRLPCYLTSILGPLHPIGLLTACVSCARAVPVDVTEALTLPLQISLLTLVRIVVVFRRCVWLHTVGHVRLTARLLAPWHHLACIELIKSPILLLRLLLLRQVVATIVARLLEQLWRLLRRLLMLRLLAIGAAHVLRRCRLAGHVRWLGLLALVRSSSRLLLLVHLLLENHLLSFIVSTLLTHRWNTLSTTELWMPPSSHLHLIISIHLLLVLLRVHIRIMLLLLLLLLLFLLMCLLLGDLLLLLLMLWELNVDELLDVAGLRLLLLLHAMRCLLLLLLLMLLLGCLVLLL